MRILSAYDETVPPGVPIRYGNGQTLVPIEDLAEAQNVLAHIRGLHRVTCEHDGDNCEYGIHCPLAFCTHCDDGVVCETARILDAVRGASECDVGLTAIALPAPVGPDGDGQVWFDDFDIRVDMTGRRDDTRLYVNGEPRSPSAVHQHAVALLAAAIVAGGGA